MSGSSVRALVDGWIAERDPTAREPTLIMLRRMYCDHLYPLPESARPWMYAAVQRERAQCMRERDGYVVPREAPASKRFFVAWLRTRDDEAQRELRCRPVVYGGCGRWIASRLDAVLGDLPAVRFCECGSDAGAVHRLNAELDKADAESRAYWSSANAGAATADT